VDRLSMLHENGRRFEVSEAIEWGAGVALGLAISQPEWSQPVEMFKVFTFEPTGDKVVGMQDCDSREAAVAMLAAV
jgi:hypothetical protein